MQVGLPSRMHALRAQNEKKKICTEISLNIQFDTSLTLSLGLACVKDTKHW